MKKIINKVKNFFIKERNRLIINPYKQAICIFFIILIQSSVFVPFFDIPDSQSSYILNFIYSVSCFFLVLFYHYVFNCLLFKNTWNYAIEIFSFSIIFILICIIIYAVGSFAKEYTDLVFVVVPNSHWLYVITIHAVTCYVFVRMYVYYMFDKKGMKENDKKFITIDYNKEVYVLDVNEILFFQTIGNYLKVFLEKNNSSKIEKPLVIRQTLKGMEDILEERKAFNFVKSHRSYFVNTSHILSVNRTPDKKYFLKLKDTDFTIPISKSKVDSFKNLLK